MIACDDGPFQSFFSGDAGATLRPCSATESVGEPSNSQSIDKSAHLPAHPFSMASIVCPPSQIGSTKCTTSGSWDEGARLAVSRFAEMGYLRTQFCIFVRKRGRRKFNCSRESELA